MSTLDRLRKLAPWDNVSEEDFYKADGLYVSIRGSVRLPKGAYFCSNEKDARALVFEPDAPLPQGCWVLNADTGAWTGTDADSVKKATHALDLVLDSFEGKDPAGVKFPVMFNVEEG